MLSLRRNGRVAIPGYDAVILARFRRTRSFEAKVGAVAAWLRIGELAAREVHCEPFDKEGLRNSLDELRSLTLLPSEEFAQRLVSICARNGVAVVIVPEIRGSRAYGATRWLTPSKAVVQLSLRYKSDDQFWFTFFHEMAHVLLHGKQDVRLEGDIAGNPEDPQEDEANNFSRDVLIPSDRHHKLGSIKSIPDAERFARNIGIAPGVVVGRLQHEKKWRHSWGNHLKRKVDLASDFQNG